MAMPQAHHLTCETIKTDYIITSKHGRSCDEHEVYGDVLKENAVVRIEGARTDGNGSILGIKKD